MGLNVKAAMIICGLCISALPVCLQRLAVSGGQSLPTLRPAGMSLHDALGIRPAPRVGGGEPVAWREEWVQRLGRPNPLDREADLNRSPGRPLAIVTPVSLEGDQAEMTLPPLAYERPPEPARADAPAQPPIDSPAVAVALEDAGPTDGDLIAEDTPAMLVPARTYRVAKGDTLTRIAQREYGSRERLLLQLLMDANPRVRGRNGHLLIGEELLIPDPALAMRRPGRQTEPAEGAVPGVGEVAKAAGEPQTSDLRWYTIQRNDSLSSIAKRFLDDSGRWREILDLNRWLDPNKMLPGTRIKLPPAVRLASR